MPKRRTGAPAHGHVQFRAVRLKRLPAIMSISASASGLGVSRKTIFKWIESGLPTFGRPYRREIRKLHLINWLVETGRYKRRRR